MIPPPLKSRRRLVRPRPKWHPYITRVHRIEILSINERLDTLRRIAASLIRRRQKIMEHYERKPKIVRPVQPKLL